MIWRFKYYDIEAGPDWVGLENDCDWFRDMESVQQDPIWHAEGNVMIHTKMVCDELINLPEFLALTEQEKHIMFTAALMHDIEKRSTTTIEFKNGRGCVVAPKHAERGEKMVRELLYKEFGCPYYVREQICKIVKWHGKPLHSCSERVIVNLATQTKLSYLTMIAKADILGRICDDADEHLERIEFFKMMGEDLECYSNPRFFSNDLSEYMYLNGDSYLDYVPYDETKFEVVLMSGLPGSGKDTYVKNNLSHLPVISLDEIRVELGVKPTDKSGNGRVIQLAKERAKIYMRKHQSFVWNGTNITKQLRSQLIDLFKSYGGLIKVIYIEVPYKTLIKQNNNREEIVPFDVLEKMIKKLEPPVREESHKIVYFN
jgi:predicted kinase